MEKRPSEWWNWCWEIPFHVDIGRSLYMNLGDELKIFEVIIGPKEEMSNCLLSLVQRDTSDEDERLTEVFNSRWMDMAVVRWRV